MKKRLLFITTALFLAAGSSYSQNLPCGSDEVIREAFDNNPQYEIDYNNLRAFAKKYTEENFNANEKGPIYQIPIVFHVIHNYGSENIDDSDILNALDDMNDEWRKRSADSANIVAPFNSIHDDMEVEFVLAKKGPNGDCSTGITRHVSDLTYSAGDNVKALTKAKEDWPSNKYLNVWIVGNIASGAGGYSYFPGISASIDGIVVLSQQLSALPHEAGHWLALPHPWGGTNDNNLPSNCNDDDMIDDTPNTQGQSFCNTARNSCSDDPVPFLDVSGNVLWPTSNGEIHDNVQNVMDYAFCNNGENFTQGQKAVTHASLNSATGGRNNLWTSTNITNTGASSSFTCEPVPVPDFALQYEYFCADYTVSMLNNSYNSNSMTYAWEFGDKASANSTTSREPNVSWSETGKYDITLTVSNQNGDGGTLTKNALAKVLNGTAIPPFSETFTSLNFPINDPNDPTKTWFIDGVSDQENSFKKTTVASSDGLTGLFLDIKNTTGIHRLITPMIDMTQTSCDELTFDLAYAPRTSSTDETFRVKYSTTCGRTWPSSNVLYTVSKQNIAPNSPVISGDFIPTENDWLRHTVDISELSGEDEVFIMFEMETNTGNSLYMDNINIGCSNSYLSSINEGNVLDFTIFPNPTNSDANINFSTNQTNTTITITDVAGKIIGFETLANGASKIKVSDIANRELDKGVYLIAIENENTIKTQKLIIK